MQSSQQYLQSLINYLHTLDPYIGTQEGDPVRLILETVATQLAQTQMNQLSTDNFLDLAIKAGSDLDAFGQFFGFQRWAGTPATGTIQLYSSTPLQQAFTIQIGTQVTDGAGHIFQTTQTSVFPQGVSQVSIPVQSVNPGSAQNVQPFTLTTLVNSLSNTNIYVQNLEACTGGTDEETDTHFRNRIKNNLFHRQYGTPESFENCVNQIDNTTRSKCLSAVSSYGEISEVVPLRSSWGGGIGFSSTINDAKYIYPNSSYLLKNADETTEQSYVEGIAYTFNTTINPVKPIFQVTSQSLSTILSTISGSQLDKFGNAMGVTRVLGSYATGQGVITLIMPNSTDTYIAKNAQFLFEDSENSVTYQFMTTQNVTIPANSISSPTVPFIAKQMGQIEIPSGASFMNGWNAPGGSSMTVSSFIQGQGSWTDEQYRSAIESAWANQTSLQAGSLVYDQFSYCSSASRNNPPAITNCLDLFIDGLLLEQTNETGIIETQTLTSDTCQNWITQSGNYPTAGDVICLLHTPCVTALSSDFTDNSKAISDTQLLKQSSAIQGSDQAQTAILFSAQALPKEGDAYSVNLICNKAVEDAQSAVDNVKTIGVDLLVHEGKKAQIGVNLVLVPLLGTPADTLTQSLNQIISDYFSNLSFGAQIIITDLLSKISQSQYVKAVRLAQTTDRNAPTISGNSLGVGLSLEIDWARGLNDGYNSDFKLPDDAYPVLSSLNISLEAFNTYVNSYMDAGNPDQDNGQVSQTEGTWFTDSDFYIANNPSSSFASIQQPAPVNGTPTSWSYSFPVYSTVPDGITQTLTVPDFFNLSVMAECEKMAIVLPDHPNQYVLIYNSSATDMQAFTFPSSYPASSDNMTCPNGYLQTSNLIGLLNSIGKDGTLVIAGNFNSSTGYNPFYQIGNPNGTTPNIEPQQITSPNA